MLMLVPLVKGVQDVYYTFEAGDLDGIRILTSWRQEAGTEASTSVPTSIFVHPPVMAAFS